MGGVLGAAPHAGAVPRIAVTAQRDPLDGPLERLQVVKGWLDGDGLHERVYDVACAGGATVDAVSHRCVMPPTPAEGAAPSRLSEPSGISSQTLALEGRSSEGERSDGFGSAGFALGRHVDEESRRSLRKRLLEQERQRSRRATAVRSQRSSFILLIGGVLILATVAAVLVYRNRERLGWLGGVDPSAAVAPPIVPARPEGEAQQPIRSVRERIRRALRFGLPLAAGGGRETAAERGEAR